MFLSFNALTKNGFNNSKTLCPTLVLGWAA
jgi:hypothetical protein